MLYSHKIFEIVLDDMTGGIGSQIFNENKKYLIETLKSYYISNWKRGGDCF